MESIKGNTKQVSGLNCYGKVQIKETKLLLQLTQFIDGAIYTFQITQVSLEKELKRILIFGKIQQLFEELAQNQDIQISKQSTLIMPIDVSYRNKTFQLKVQLPLLRRNFNNQAQKTQELFQTIRNMNKLVHKYIHDKDQKIQKQRRWALRKQQQFLFIPQPIAFKGDQTNKRFTIYDKSNDNRILTMLGNNQWICYNHSSVLPDKGIFYFKIKVIKTTSKSIFIGICKQQIKQKVDQDLFQNAFFMGFYLGAGNLWQKGSSTTVATGYTVTEGQSIFKVQVDMNQRSIYWFHNNTLLHSTQLSEMLDRNICPMVAFYHSGDSIQFIER